MPSISELLLRLVLVIFIGGLIGIERELKSKSAGFRTIMLICMGSFLFTTFSQIISPSTPDRIASTIVTGIGFLGAGVIFKADNKVNGLTTAATIWITAALGMGVATGYYIFVLIATIVVFGSLFLLKRMEVLIDNYSQNKVYKITLPNREHIMDEYEKLFCQFELKCYRAEQVKDGNTLIVSWLIKGKAKNHNKFIQSLLIDETVKRFEV